MLTDIREELKDKFWDNCKIAVLRKKYNLLAKRIVKSQKRLRKKDKKNNLLNIIQVNNGIIQWTREFESRYQSTNDYRGITDEEMFNQYIEDLEKATSK